jgi:hypothetical protein
MASVSMTASFTVAHLASIRITAAIKTDSPKQMDSSFELESGHTLAQGLCAPHSPVCVDGLWTVCDSLRHAVIQFDASTGLRVKQKELRAFTCGLAVTDDYLIVGESIQRRGTSNDLAGSFAVLRRSDLSLVARFPVPFREVSDIVVVPRSLAHAAKTGFRTNPLRVSETDQLQMFRDVGVEPARLWTVGKRLTPSQCRIKVQASVPFCSRTVNAHRLRGNQLRRRFLVLRVALSRLYLIQVAPNCKITRVSASGGDPDATAENPGPRRVAPLPDRASVARH